MAYRQRAYCLGKTSAKYPLYLGKSKAFFDRHDTCTWVITIELGRPAWCWRARSEVNNFALNLSLEGTATALCSKREQNRKKTKSQYSVRQWLPVHFDSKQSKAETLIVHFLMSLGVSERASQPMSASKHVIKQAGWNQPMSKFAKQVSE